MCTFQALIMGDAGTRRYQAAASARLGCPRIGLRRWRCAGRVAKQNRESWKTWYMGYRAVGTEAGKHGGVVCTWPDILGFASVGREGVRIFWRLEDLAARARIMPRILWMKSRLVPGDWEKRIYAEEIHKQMGSGSLGQLAGNGLDELPFKPVFSLSFQLRIRGLEVWKKASLFAGGFEWLLLSQTSSRTPVVGKELSIRSIVIAVVSGNSP
ncbi:hypothetical protein V8E51_009710 [Hyaloscypha variabilis]